MKSSLWLLPLALAGCNKQSTNEDSSSENSKKVASIPKLTLTALELTAHTAMESREAERQKLEQMESRASKAMESYLFDPYSVKFRSLRAGRGGAICGQYNAKNRLGAYVGFRDFVIGKDGKSIYASRNSDGVETELYTSFADAYVNACATKAEANLHAALTAPYPNSSNDSADYYYADDDTPMEDEPKQLEDPFAE